MIIVFVFFLKLLDETMFITMQIGLTSKAKGSSSKKFSPIVFYGSPRGVPPKRPSSLWRLLREIRVDLSEQSRIKLRYI